MEPRPRRFSGGVRWALWLFVLLGLQLFLTSNLARERGFGGPWAASYVVSLLFLVRRLRHGELLDPAVCLVGSYLLLLSLGSLLFGVLRANSLSPWAMNAIGVGHAALWGGCVLGGTVPPSPVRSEVGIGSRQASGILMVVVLACAGATFALFATFGRIPLLAADPDEARLAILAGRGELAVFLVGLTLLAYAFLHDALVNGASTRWAHLLMAATFLVLISLGGRSRALLFVLGYVGLALLLRPRPLRVWVLATSAVAVLVVLAGVGAWRRQGNVRIPEAVAELGIGTLALPAMVARLEQRVEAGSLDGGPLSDLLTLLPGEDHGANVALKYQVFQNWRALPASAGVNPSLIGEGYLFYGIRGVLWWPFLLGLLSALLYQRLAKSGRFPGLAFYVCWITCMMSAISAGVGIRLTHFVQQVVWIGLIGLFFLSRTRLQTGSKASEPLDRVGRLA